MSRRRRSAYADWKDSSSSSSSRRRKLLIDVESFTKFRRVNLIDLTSNDDDNNNNTNNDRKRVKTPTSIVEQAALDVAVVDDSAISAMMMMNRSIHGKAWKFVEQVLALHDKLQAQSMSSLSRHFSPIARDEMYDCAVKLFQQQALFLNHNNNNKKKKETHVDIAYHYTSSQCIQSIGQEGLLTKADRDKLSMMANIIQPQPLSRSFAFGDGIYTADGPGAFERYGDCGILVARLKGETKRVLVKPNEQMRQFSTSFDTIIGNKKLTKELCNTKQQHGNGNVGLVVVSSETFASELQELTKRHDLAPFDEVVLQSSSQCLALIRYNKVVRQSHEGKRLVFQYHTLLQSIVDHFFNMNGRRRKSGRDHPWLVSLSRGNGKLPLVKEFSVPATTSRTATSATTEKTTTKQCRRPAFSLPAVVRPRNPDSNIIIPVRDAKPAASRRLPNISALSFGGPSRERSKHREHSSSKATSLRSHVSSQVPKNNRRRLTAAAAIKPPPVPPTHIATLTYQAPETLQPVNPESAFDRVSVYNGSSDEACHVCLEPLRGGISHIVALKECRHMFHMCCALEALRWDRKCPLCRQLTMKPQGKMPSGTMAVNSSPTVKCSGYEDCGSIIIHYNIPSGKQKKYHDHPGRQHGRAYRAAYLPDNEEGRMLLKRLMHAFRHGLTFTVGHSLSRRKDDCVTWASIHHKTSPNSGAHGFPDLGYFVNCNEDLDALGIPKAADCPDH